MYLWAVIPWSTPDFFFFLPLIRSQSKAAIILGPLREWESNCLKIPKSHITSHVELDLDFNECLAVLRKDFCNKSLGWAYIRFICAERTMVRQVTLAPCSANRDLYNHQDLSVKLHLNVNEKCPRLVWPLAVTLISLAVTIEHTLGNRLTRQSYVHGKHEFLSHCLCGDSLHRGGRHLNGAAHNTSASPRIHARWQLSPRGNHQRSRASSEKSHREREAGLLYRSTSLQSGYSSHCKPATFRGLRKLQIYI